MTVTGSREALEFYADPFAWKKKHDPDDVVRIPDFYSETSFGDTAVEALAALSADPAPVLTVGEVSERAMFERIAEVVKEAGHEGAAAEWHPCSGCYETEDGHPVGRYPFSKIFHCDVGSGCHECGGLGVVWNYYSARDLAELEQQSVDPEPDETAMLTVEEIAREINNPTHSVRASYVQGYLYGNVLVVRNILLPSPEQELHRTTDRELHERALELEKSRFAATAILSLLQSRSVQPGAPPLNKGDE